MRPPRILVIDQPARIEGLIRAGILYYPVDMSFSSCKKEAFDEISKAPPDLLISGMLFDDGNAADLIREVRSKVLFDRSALMPGIFIAEPSENQTAAQVQQQILKLGAFDIIQRPFEMHALHRKIDHAVMVVKNLKRKTRIESFIDDEFQKLIEESSALAMPVSELIKLKQAPKE